MLVLDVQDLPTGWYHVAVSPPQLELIRKDVPSETDLCRLFPLAYARVPIHVQAIIILTCVFSRNAYRYLEPRTFRTVHMDAGYLASTVSLVASCLDVGSHIAYGNDDEGIEAQLGLNGLQEG